MASTITMLGRTATRAASTSATAATSSSGASSSSALSAYLLLSRPPTILRSPTPFESAYHAYNSKLQQVLSQPFARDIYFKKGSAAEKKFMSEESERRKPLQGPNSSSSKDGKEEGQIATSDANQVNEVEGQDLYRTVSRRTKADEENNMDSLDRSLDRNLFLMVRGGEMGKEWTLPHTKLDKDGKASLHKAAPQAVTSLFGEEMDIWMVSNLPIGLLSMVASTERGYVMRAHILAGQPNASLAKGVELAWLTREEIQERVEAEQWTEIEGLLSA